MPTFLATLFFTEPTSDGVGSDWASTLPLIIGAVVAVVLGFTYDRKVKRSAPVPTRSPLLAEDQSSEAPLGVADAIGRFQAEGDVTSLRHVASFPMTQWIRERPLRELLLADAADRGDDVTLFDGSQDLLDIGEVEVDVLVSAAWSAIYARNRETANNAMVELERQLPQSDVAWLRLKAAWAIPDALALKLIIDEHGKADPVWDLARGDQAILTKSWAEASESYDRFLQVIPDAHETRIRAAYAALKQRKFKEAESILDGLSYVTDRERWLMQRIRDRARVPWMIVGAVVGFLSVPFLFAPRPWDLAGFAILVCGVGLVIYAMRHGKSLRERLQLHGETSVSFAPELMLRTSIAETGRTI